VEWTNDFAWANDIQDRYVNGFGIRLLNSL